MVMINKPINGLLKVYGNNQLGSPSRVKPSFSAKGPEADKLVLSDSARVLQVANQVLKKTPEIRMNKVAALKEAINNGKYQVSATQIAEAMLQDSGISSLAE